MKRLMLLLAFLISIGTSAFGQLVKEVTLSSTTNLAAALGDEVATVTTLKITGPLTEADFATMKNDMAMLQVLDMSGVTELPTFETWINNVYTTLTGIPSSALQNKQTLQHVVFPSCLEAIGSNSFSECYNLFSLDFTFATNIKYIVDAAFNECHALQSLEIKAATQLVYIGSLAFQCCNNLKTVDLSMCTNLCVIESAFNQCPSLQKVDLSGCERLEYLGNSAFCGCSALNELDLTGCISLTRISSWAFENCEKLTDFDFAELKSLKYIEGRAFQNTNLTGIISFPSSINQLGEYSFQNCDNIDCIDLSNSSIAVVSANTFSDCEKLEKVDFTGCTSLNTLNKDAFNNCPALQEVKIDNGFYKSEDGVLYVVDMATLMLYPAGKSDAAFTIPSSVLTIQSSAFPYNTNLKKLTIPESVKSIQPDAFLRNESTYPYANPIYTVIMEAATPIGLSANIGLNSAIIYVPRGALEAYKGTAIWKDYTLIETGAEGTTVDLETAGSLGAKLTEKGVTPNTIQELTVTGPMNASDFEVIKQMTLLTKVDLSGTKMEENRLPNNAFKNLSYLKEVKLPDEITVIGENAFADLSNFETVNLPTEIVDINYRAFDGCRSLNEIDLSTLEHLRSIGGYAFRDCHAIPSVLKLPNSLEIIQWDAFWNTKVTSVDFSNTSLRSIENGAFGDCAITGELSFPATLTYIGSSAFNAATPTSIKLKSAEIVRLGGTDVFNATDKTTCKVYVSKGLGAMYKADTYWSPFGNNIEEYGYLVTVTQNNNYGMVSGGGAYEAGETVTLTADPNNPSEYAAFGGWYENNQRISSNLVYTFIMGTSDRIIEARFYWNGADDWWEERVVDDSNKIDGLNISASRLTVNGELPWALNSFVYKWPFHSYILVNSPMSATTIEVKAHPEELCVGWNFISLPYDVKISDIGKPYESSQFVIRYYDGASRAADGMGGSWKQLGANDVMKANQGYIMRTNGGSPEDVWYTFNSSIDDMSSLFNRQAVTIDLPKHASTVSADANWNLVGNPFPCYFSVEQLFDAGLDGTVTVWSDQLQNYEYYTQDDQDVYLAPLTAFFIQHNQAASVIFKPEGRAATLPTTRAAVADLRSDEGREVINLLLANDSLSDKTRVVFNEAASTDYELGKDAAKFSSMNNNAPSLYTLDAQNQQLAINERPVGNGVVRLGCYIGVKGSYTLSAKEALASDLYLYDTETGASCNLRETSYTFTAEAGACNNRFELRTSLKGTGIAAIEGFSWQVAGNQLLLNGLPTGATVSLFDANGRMLFSGDAATATQGIALPQSGIYYLTIRTAEGVSSTVSIKR